MPSFQTVMHNLEVCRGKGVEAVAEYLATLSFDPAFDAWVPQLIGRLVRVST